MHPSFPAKLGRYEILEEIGKGAMGVVYLARDPLIGRQVALKTFRVGLSVRDAELDQFRARFMREAQSAGILSHPNIVTIHDVVESGEEGLAFIAMEYVRGTNLKSVMQDGRPLTLPYVAEVVGQVAEALEYAHSSKVVHRDVKPANILITHDGRVKITDFGIARLDTSNLTQEGQLLGTPNYMSPEQILGREIDHRADIFSLGVMLYEMLTRHKPFQGDNLTVVSHRIVYDSFTPVKEYVRELPPEIERVLEKALEKDPGRRFQRARELGEELRRAVGGPAHAEALNETLGLSNTFVLPATAARAEGTPPPPFLPPLPLPAGDPLAATHSGAPAVPAMPATPLMQTPRRAEGTGSIPAAGRRGLGAAIAAGVILLLLAGAVVGLWLWRRQSGTLPAPPAASAAELTARQAEAFARQGQEKLAGGDIASAVALLSRAQQLAPARADVAQLLTEARRLQSERSQMTGQQLTFAAKLAEARLAFDGKRFDEAEAAVAAALQLQPDDAEAAKLLEAVRAGRTGQRRERLAAQGRQGNRTPQETPLGTGEPVAPPPVPTAPPAETVARPALLLLSFSSQLPGGVVMLMVNGKVVLREDFRYYEGGRFRSRPSTGSFRRQIEVPTGNNDVSVFVTPTGQGARTKSFGGNFPGGQTRTLEVSLDGSGEVRANLH